MPERPNTGWAESLGDGLRRDHRVACPSSTDRKRRRHCACPYSCWVPDRTKRSGQRRVKVDGTLSVADAKREKQRLTVEARARESAPAAPALAAVGERTPTVYEWAQRCMRVTWRDLAPNTRAIRKTAYERFIHPHLGAHQLDQVTPLVVSDWFDRIIRDHQHTRSVEHAGETLRAMMNVAVDLEILARCPVRRIPRVPKDDPRRRGQRVLSREQYDRLKAACVDKAELTLVRVAVECCLRRGELCALRWSDIDHARRRIVVSRQVSKAPGQRPIEGPRKAGGIAEPALTPDLSELLAAHRATAVAAGARAGDHVWPGRGALGSRWDHWSAAYPDAMGKRLRRVVERAGLVDVAGNPLALTHDLRRTGASLVAAAGVPEVIVQHQLGHASPDTTREFYIRRPDDSLQDAFANVFELHPAERG